MDNNTLLELLRDQKQELSHYASMHFCKRKEEKEINLNSKKAQVVIGVRRCGKSTLCYQALTAANVNFAYVNFDDERLGKLGADSLNEVLRALYQIYGDFTHLFIDEAQNIDGWHLFVNRLLRQGLKIIITGSNAKLLSSELSTHLTGRYNEIELYPFSFGEFCEVQEVSTIDFTTKGDAFLRTAFENYLQIGGFPEIANGEETPEPYIDTLVSNIIERDIVQRFKIKYRDAFTTLTNHMLNNAPCGIVLTKLQQLFNIKTDHTVENYLSYMFQAYLMMRVRKFSTKSSERVRNAKCYVVDVALMNARKDAFSGKNLGLRLETVVYIELRRRYGVGYDIYFYLTDSYEVDFVVCHRNTVIELIQVSYNISNDKTYRRELNALLKASTPLKCNNLTLITAFDEKTIEESGKTINVRTAYRWLLS